VPAFIVLPKMRLEPRAECKHITMDPAMAEGAPNSLTWRLVKCGINPALQAPYSSGPVAAADAATAYNMMGGANGRITTITGSGYYGGGYWTAAGTKYYCLVIVNMPVGMSP